MAVENVVLNVDVDGAAASIAQLAAINRNIRAMNTATRNNSRLVDDAEKGFRRFEKRLNKVDGVLKKLISPAKSFLKVISKFGFIALAGEIALFTAALLGIKLALVTGRAAATGYQIVLQGVAIAAAGVATAIATAAAALRQFNEVGLSPYLGGGASGISMAARASRSLSPRVSGLLGGEGATSVTSSLVRGGARASEVNRLATTIFALSGGDTKATVGLAGALQTGDFEKSLEAVKSSAGFKAGSLEGVTTQRQLIEALLGDASVKEEFKTIGEDLANTFVGTLKVEFAGLKTFFADIGEPLLEPFRQSFLSISKILKEDMLSVAAVIQKVGADTFAPTLVKVVDSVSNFFRKMIVGNIDSLNNFADRMVTFFGKTQEFFRDIGDLFNAMKQFEPAADVVIEMFKAIGGAAGGANVFKTFSDLVVANKDAFVDFGAAIGELIRAIFELFKVGNTGFFGKLGTLSETLRVLADKFVPAVQGVFAALMPIFEKIPTVISAISDVIVALTPVLSTVATVVGAMVGPISSLASTFAGPVGAAIVAMFLGAKVGKAGLGLLNMIGGGDMAKGWGRLRGGTRNAGQFIGRNAMTIGGTLATGYGLYDTLFQQTGGGLVGGLSTGLGVGMLTKSPQAGLIAGGTSSLVGGTLDVFKTGDINAGNAMSTIGGGAVAGATIGAMLAPVSMGASIAIGAAIGAVVGAIALGLGNFFGDRRIKEATNKFNEGLSDLALAISDPVGMTADRLTQAQTMLDDINRLLDLDAESNEFSEIIDKYKEQFAEMGVDFDELNNKQIKEYLEGKDIEKEMLDNINQATWTYYQNMKALEIATGESGEQILRLAEKFNVDLFDSTINGANAIAMFRAEMDKIDLMRGVLPDVASTSLGKAEMNATASAALDALVKAENLTPDMISAFVESASAYEVAMGRSPLVASFGPIRQLEQMAKSKNVAPERQLELAGISQELLASVISQIEEVTDGEITGAELTSAFRDKGFTDIYGQRRTYTSGLSAVDAMVQEQDRIESALAIGSTTDPQERMKMLTEMGFGDGSDWFRNLSMRVNVGGYDEMGALALNSEISRYLMQTDSSIAENASYGQEQVALLQGILANTGTETTVIIAGVEYTVNPESTISVPVSTPSHVTVSNTLAPQGNAPAGTTSAGSSFYPPGFPPLNP